jgi:ribosomal protein L11 methyltransferase
VEQNQVSERVTAICASLGIASQLGHWLGGEIAEDVPAIVADGEFDLIVANIFARVHISLAAEFYKALRNNSRHSGILITAGYTSDRAEDIDFAMTEVGFRECDRLQIDEWIAIAYQKTSDERN